MRTLILLIASVVVFVGAYLALAWLLPDPDVAAPQRADAVVRAAPRPSEGVIGDVEGITLRRHDVRTGAPIAEIRIGAYRRASEAQVVLSRVEATMLVSDGGVVTINAPTGVVDVDGTAEADGGQITAEALGGADTARLRDVTVRYYADAAAATRGPAAASLTLQVDNLAYDNERLSLATADTVIGGATVLADDVRVTVRGTDYDFDGQGLLVRWDAATRRPTLVRIAQGERLTIKTPQPFVPSQVVRGGPNEPAALASSQDTAVADALAVSRAAVEPYRATLERAVTVEQGGLMKLESDYAEAVFALAEREPSEAEPPARQPRPPATTAAEPGEPDAPFEPVTVRWAGELRIESIENSADVALRGEGDARLNLVGAPLIMREQNAEARCRELQYHRAADELLLIGEAADPVTLIDAEGNTLVTGRLLTRPDAGTALAPEAGYAEVLADEGQRLQVRWAGRCAFTFDKGAGAEDRPTSLRRMAAAGGVAVRHPDVSVDADALDVELEPTDDAAGDDAGRAQVRRVLATGNVRSLLGGREERTALDAQRLTLTTPQGPGGPIVALAEGDVRTDQAGQRLASQRLEVRLEKVGGERPTLREMRASGGVNGTDDAGRTLTADTLTVAPAVPAGDEDRMHVRLEGTVDRPAGIRAGDEVLLAPMIEFLTVIDTYRVPGVGELHTRQAAAEGREATTARITWTGGMTGDPANVAVEGAVRIHAEQGATVLNVESARADLQLTEAARDGAQGVPQPQAQDPAVRGRRGAGRIAGDIEKVTLEGELRVTAEERDGPALSRSFDLRTERLEAWPMAETVRVVIPGSGRVLYRDLRTPAARPADEAHRPAAGQRGAGGAVDGFRGNAAFSWQGSLAFEPDTGLLTLTGGATVVVEPGAAQAGAKGAVPARFELVSDRLIAATAHVAGRVEFRQLTAEGRSRFETEGVAFEATRITYDPAAQTVTALGDAGAPVTVLDARGVPTGRFGTLVYNVNTGQIERLTDLNAAR